MKKFEVFESAFGDLRAVKRGFSYPGLLFQWIWLGYKGLYAQGTLFFLAYVLSGNLIYGMEEQASPVMHGLMASLPILEHPSLIENETLRVSVGLLRTLTFGLIIGAFGNSWYRSKLLKSGFMRIAEAEAQSAELAIDQFRRSETP